MATNIEDSAEFRQHIHNLLHDYSKTHYTTDYISFTEDLVAEFIENLRPVPLTDPYSLTLAVDPFDTFAQKNSIHSLPPYDENPQTSADAVAYLKRVMNTKRGRPKTERIVFDDNYGRDILEGPLFPALTRKSRRQTPKLGQKNGEPRTLKDVLEVQKISTVEVEPVQEPVVAVEDVLQLKHQIDPQELPTVKALLQATTDALRPQKSYKNKYLDPTFLRNDFRSDPIPFPEEFFVPIFPRVPVKTGKACEKPAFAPSCFKDLIDKPSIALKKTVVEDPDGDISLQNLMVIVDGWETIKSSPPSTPSSTNSDEDQVDQLYLPSTPETEPTLAEELEKAKMDEILIPRSRKIGGKDGVAPHILHGQTLGSFLKPLLPPLASKEETKEDAERHSSPLPSSILGQPPSTLLDDDMDDPHPQKSDDNDGLESDLMKLYEGHTLNNFILDETLDDKQSLLMEVLDLPPPNVHLPNGMHVPRAFTDFLIPPLYKDKKARPQADLPAHQFLKKLKGLQSLGLSLSWVTFTVDKKLPTALEIVDVMDLFPEARQLEEGKLNSDSDYAQAMKLLASIDLAGRPNDDTVPMFMKFKHEQDTPPPPYTSDGDFKILLNRQERRRLAQMEGRAREYEKEGGDVKAGMEDIVVQEDEEHDSDKSLNLGRNLVWHERAADEENMLEEGEPQRKRLKLDATVEDETQPRCSYPLTLIEDSGIFFRSGSPGPEIQYDEDGKENLPPFSSSSISAPMDESSDFYVQDNEHGYDDDRNLQNESFEPLSFGSRPVPPTCLASLPIQHDPWAEDLRGDEQLEDASPPPPSLRPQPDQKHQGMSLLEPLPLLPAFPELEITSHSLGIAAFAQLRARKVSASKTCVNAEPQPYPQPSEASDKPCPPTEIFDANTVYLPDPISVPNSVHFYMASLEFIQKQAIVRALKSDICAVELVERETLGGVDLIVDPNCAVLFLSLFTLPARCEAYVEKVAQQSWKFGNLLVLFEAYPEQRSRRWRDSRKTVADDPAFSLKVGCAPDLNAYTAPILKAIKKLRRDVSIAEACGTKRPETAVQYAFANTVDEAALLTRWYGDSAEAADETEGAIWGQRMWLMQDYLEDEETNLATIDGLNHFSASIVLCQVPLEDFLNMPPEQRTDGFASFIGLEAMTRCNVDLEARIAAVHSSSVLSSG
ncbi:hypothetical protein NLJ89_g2311 [Agrocybe chaxingu]|uniref:Uncharacterized protein n=1 Tax=Agrocybe chaxingu TaxID=84603 RepID=A0A9W8K4M4_9AGAR|nr:hypothetical protein NLJ89_g2311 [Agrocybe chaxingu]